MIYVIKRKGDDEFHLEGDFEEIKEHFDFSDEVREEMVESYYDELEEFDDAVDSMDELCEIVNKISGNGMEYYVESRSIDLEAYIEAYGDGYNEIGDRTEILVDNITNDQMHYLKDNEFIGYDVWHQFGDCNENRIIIDNQCVGSVVCEVVTATEASELLKISTRAVREKCEAAEYVCRKSGSVWLIEKDSLPL